MDDHARFRHLRLIVFALLGTGVIAALFGWFEQSDGSALFLVMVLASVIIFPIAGLILLVVFAMLARDGWRIGSTRAGRTRWLSRGAAPIGLVLAFASLEFVPGVFASFHRQHLLAENRSVFENAMRQDATRITLTNGEEVSATPASAGRYYVSFARMGDNHHGFVRDPSGQVVQARGWADGEAGRFTAPDQVRNLFGGDMLECAPVRGEWFFCTFT